MSNYVTGQDAEARAAEYLTQHGYKIRERNWKTRYCEIDIVAEKEKVIFFIEVKYRRNARQGLGLEYVTPRKLRQMEFAAEMWVSNHMWEGPYELGVVSIDADEITYVNGVL